MTIRQSVPREMPHVLDFDGVDDTVVTSLTSNDVFTTGNGFTMWAWINARSLGGNNVGRIFDKSTATDASGGFYFNVLGNRQTAMRIMGGNERRSASNAFNFNRWFLTLVTVDPDARVTHYINAVQSGTALITGAFSGITTENPLTLGNRSTATDRTFDGLMGKGGIVPRVLTKAEIDALYYHNIIPADTAHYWNRLSDDGTQLLDTVGGAHGTIDGATRVTNLFGIPTPRKSIVPYVGALSFDGVDDDVQASKIVFGTDPYTIRWKGWAKELKANNPFISQRAPGISTEGGCAIRNEANTGTVRIICFKANGTTTFKSSITDTGFIKPFELVDLVFSFENQVIRLWKNGIPVTLTVQSDGNSNTTVEGFLIGQQQNEQWGNIVTQNVRVYKAGLTTKEVEDLYLYNTTPYDNDRAICRLNLETTAGQIVGDTWLDKSGNNNHGTITGAVLV